jgi:hypothetical protein
MGPNRGAAVLFLQEGQMTESFNESPLLKFSLIRGEKYREYR